MPRFLGWLLAILTLTPAVSTAAPAKPQGVAVAEADRFAQKCWDDIRRTRALQAELQGLMDEGSTLAAKIEDPRWGYPAAPDLPALQKQHGEVDRAWDRIQRGYRRLHDEYRGNMSQVDTCRSFGAIGGPFVAAAGPDIGDFLDSALELERFGRDYVRLFSDVSTKVGKDSELFAAELARRQAAARRRRIGLVLATLAPAALAVLTLWRRRASRRALVPAPAAHPAAGSVLGGAYRVERELGRGEMGIVYEAADLTLGRKVAVKRMLEDLSGDPAGVEGFLKEARSVAALKHPNIMGIYTVLREAGQVCLVLELVEGKCLSRYIAAGQRLPLKFVKSVIRQTCSALEHAHERGIVHRDLKPGNIMVAPSGSVKVMDFGIARQTRAAAARLTGTRPLGTPLYMAPEQELGNVSKASDLFALGVCAYEMLTGARPYAGPDFLAQKQGMSFTPPSQAVPGSPREIDAFMRRALQAEPGERFRSAEEFAAAFEALPDTD